MTISMGPYSLVNFLHLRQALLLIVVIKGMQDCPLHLPRVPLPPPGKGPVLIVRIVKAEADTDFLTGRC